MLFIGRETWQIFWFMHFSFQIFERFIYFVYYCWHLNACLESGSRCWHQSTKNANACIGNVKIQSELCVFSDSASLSTPYLEPALCIQRSLKTGWHVSRVPNQRRLNHSKMCIFLTEESVSGSRKIWKMAANKKKAEHFIKESRVPMILLHHQQLSHAKNVCSASYGMVVGEWAEDKSKRWVTQRHAEDGGRVWEEEFLAEGMGENPIPHIGLLKSPLAI